MKYVVSMMCMHGQTEEKNLRGGDMKNAASLFLLYCSCTFVEYCGYTYIR